MNGLEEVSKVFFWVNRFDAERDDCQPHGKGFCHFAPDMFRIVGASGKHQEQRPGVSNAPHDAFGPTGPRFDIPRSNPTFDSSGLEMVTNRVRDCLIFARMADEDRRRHVSSAISESYPFWSRIACTKSLVISDKHERKNRADSSGPNDRKELGTIKRVQLDFPLAPTPDTDSGERYRNRPSSHQLEWRLGTGKRLRSSYESP